MSTREIPVPWWFRLPTAHPLLTLGTALLLLFVFGAVTGIGRGDQCTSGRVLATGDYFPPVCTTSDGTVYTQDSWGNRVPVDPYGR